MTVFLRLLSEKDKGNALLQTCETLRDGASDFRVFETPFALFDSIPGKPFAYWASQELFSFFQDGERFQNKSRKALVTNGTTDDGRWIRTWWEPSDRSKTDGVKWVPHAKGGAFSPFYSDLHLVIAWGEKEETYPGYQGTIHRPDIRPASLQYFFMPGLTWSRRNSTGLSFRVLPKGAIFGDKGPAIVFLPFDEKECLAVCSVINSVAFRYLVSLQLGTVKLAQSYEAGVIQQTPFPKLNREHRDNLADLAKRAWHLKRAESVCEETSHAFLLPTSLLNHLSTPVLTSADNDIGNIRAEMDRIAFDLYGFGSEDRSLAFDVPGSKKDVNTEGQTSELPDDDNEDEDGVVAVDQTDGLLSWAAGVAFGRFDWRLATGERATPPEPDPFDPLPAKSPGMLPDDAEPFHAHSGILVDDQGHPHDLARLIEEVLARVDAPVPADVRRWLQRDFFPLHLKLYSKSRRKAPIYWPLSTSSGSYTLWLYYPSLSDQTLFTAVNDFIEGPNGKMKQVEQDLGKLRTKGSARSRDEEKNFEALQALELELIELRDTLLAIANTYRPNHDDGVPITAAPLWHLFRYKPWQKILKDTWTKLEKGDYDWAHLAMAYWPDRVRQKCITDKSLAIAHDLEHLYVEAEPKPTKAGGRKKTGKE
jgi:hypothetical protein